MSDDAGVKKLSEKQLVRQKQKWIKVTYNKVTKRITNIPSDLQELKLKIWDRFGQLKDDYEPASIVIMA